MKGWGVGKPFFALSWWQFGVVFIFAIGANAWKSDIKDSPMVGLMCFGFLAIVLVLRKGFDMWMTWRGVVGIDERR